MIGVNTNPAIKPPICAKYATPPPFEDISLDKEKNCPSIQILRTIHAGTLTVLIKIIQVIKILKVINLHISAL